MTREIIVYKIMQILTKFKSNNKEIIALIWKGILFHITVFITVLFIAGIDNLSNKNILIGIVIITSLFYTCKKAKYTDKELDIISGNALIRKKLHQE